MDETKVKLQYLGNHMTSRDATNVEVYTECLLLSVQPEVQCVIKHCQWSSMKVEGRTVTLELETFLRYTIIKFCHIPTMNDQDNKNLTMVSFLIYKV